MVSLVCVCFWGYFSSIEIKQLMIDPCEYICDPWNYIDLSSSFLNAWYLIMINTCAVTNSVDYFSV